MLKTAPSHPSTDTIGTSPEMSTVDDSRFATSLTTTLANPSRPGSPCSISTFALPLHPEALLNESSAGAQMSGGKRLGETSESKTRSPSFATTLPSLGAREWAIIIDISVLLLLLLRVEREKAILYFTVH